jgi:hypothetical protein
MNPLSVFKTVEMRKPLHGGITEIRELLEPETLFEETPSKSWSYRGRGKLFNGFMNGPQFLLIQRPMRGTRFGTVFRGDYVETVSLNGEVEITSWVDPRAKRKLIFGYFLSVILIARVVRDRMIGQASVDTDSIMPYALLAVFPITLFGSYLYEKTRQEGIQAIDALFKSQS